MNICMIGTGYVGLVTGTCFSETGNDVMCVDIDTEKISMLNKGQVPIYEPGLDEMIKRNVSEGRLSFSTDIARGVKESLFIFIAVGTPSSDDGSADLSSVWAVAREIGKHMNGYKIIVTKSTVPVGTTERVREIIRKETTETFDVASNPEFLKEGAAIDDFMKPDRVVVGTEDPRVSALMKELYAPFVRTGNPVLIMDIRSSELTKYAANAMLATRISFMNEMANLCEKLGADINLVRRGMGSDPRIGSSFLFPGVGYGGSCFPKDVKAIIKFGLEAGYEMKILPMVEEVNYLQKSTLADKVIQYYKGTMKGRKVAIWGLSFKPKTDDMRDAPSLEIIKRLLEAGAVIEAFDPVAVKETRKIIGERITYGMKNYDVLKDADALLVVTEWNEFREPDFEKIKSLMKHPVIFDGRNIYDAKKLREKGFQYFGIGIK
ncbi:MAG: UDP-glucose/GDP-mannose dehydrogenase family protein [Proteobacteria bacterium]|nr:UDP-glucose/GDP-mannose dehydrogenase family protein [Pseudomonadota bacterium]